MASKKWLPREDIRLTRQQLAEYLFEKLTSGQRLDEAIAELIASLNSRTAEPGVQALAYRSRHRHSPKHFVTASTVKRWFYEAIPDPKRRIRERAVEVLRAGMEIEDVGKLMRIPVRSLHRWLRESAS